MMPVCDPWTALKFVDTLGGVDDCNECLQSCSETIYSTSLTSAAFRQHLNF